MLRHKQVDKEIRKLCPAKVHMTSLTCTSIPHNSFGYPSFTSYTGILMCVKVQEVGLKHRRFLSNIYQIYKFCYSSVHQDQLLLLAHWLSPCQTCGIQQKSVIFYPLMPQILTLISNHQLCQTIDYKSVPELRGHLHNSGFV